MQRDCGNVTTTDRHTYRTKPHTDPNWTYPYAGAARTQFMWVRLVCRQDDADTVEVWENSTVRYSQPGHRQTAVSTRFDGESSIY